VPFAALQPCLSLTTNAHKKAVFRDQRASDLANQCARVPYQLTHFMPPRRWHTTSYRVVGAHPPTTAFAHHLISQRQRASSCPGVGAPFFIYHGVGAPPPITRLAPPPTTALVHLLPSRRWHLLLPWRWSNTSHNMFTAMLCEQSRRRIMAGTNGASMRSTGRESQSPIWSATAMASTRGTHGRICLRTSLTWKLLCTIALSPSLSKDRLQTTTAAIPGPTCAWVR
jgi:hypothetical protein